MSSKDPEITQQYSKRQRQTMGAIRPFYESSVSAARKGRPGYDVAPTPDLYSIPDTTGLTPSMGWEASLNPYSTGGITAPYGEASSLLSGMFGRTGDYAQGQSELIAQAALNDALAQDFGASAWQMTSPAYAQNFAAQLGANQAGYGGEMEAWRQNILAQQLPYEMLGPLYGQILAQPTTVVHPTNRSIWTRGILSGVGGLLQSMSQMGGMGGSSGGGGMGGGGMGGMSFNFGGAGGGAGGAGG